MSPQRYAIDEKIQSLDYKNYKAEIKTADAQDSHQAGVIVLVTGSLTGKDNVKRKFAQTFFLAPQEKGYFVQNDVFRYVDETDPLETTSASVGNVVDSGSVDQAVLNAEVTHVSNNSTYDSTTNSVAKDLDNEPEVCDPEDNGGLGSGLEEEVVNEPASVQTISNETSSVRKPDSSATQEEKKSYASVLRVNKISGASASGNVQSSGLRWAPANTDQHKPRPAKPSPEPETSAPVSVNGPESNNTLDDGNKVEGHSIYVRSLPMNATVTQLEEEFKKFGPIKSNGVQVRSNKQGFCFGFVEFESLDSMHSAIKEQISEPPLVAAEIDSVFVSLDALNRSLKWAITSVVNLRLAGRCSPILAAFDPLTPLLKLDNGIRPIAVGTIWRRLVSKVAMKGVGKEMSKYVSDFQIVVGVSGGAEAVLHSVIRVSSEYYNDGSLKGRNRGFPRVPGNSMDFSI
ncbi:putative G3BP-like protein isoform X1 [Tanacetum coccineum]